MDARMGSFNQTVTQLAASLKPLRRPFLTPAGLCARPSLISVPPTSARSGLLGARLTRNWSWHARSRGARSTNSREVTAANFVEFESDVEEKARKSQVGRRARPQIRSLVKAVFMTWVLLQAKNLHRCRVETVKKSDKKCLLYFLFFSYLFVFLFHFHLFFTFFVFSVVFLMLFLWQTPPSPKPPPRLLQSPETFCFLFLLFAILLIRHLSMSCSVQRHCPYIASIVHRCQLKSRHLGHEVCFSILTVGDICGKTS